MDETDKRIADAIRVLRELGDKTDSSASGVVARETLHDELGIYGPTERHSSYQLDAETRDVLIVHGRQDASHAMANTERILQRIAELARLAKLLLAFMIVITGLLVVIAGKVLR